MKTADFINKKPKTIEEAIVETPVVDQQELVMPEFTMESAEAEYNKLLDEAVLSGNIQGGPKNTKDFKDKEDYLLRQLASPAQSANYPELRRALNDLRRVAKERGINEDASAGATGSSSVAAVVGGLGNGTQSIIKRQQGYTNQRTKGGAVKAKK